MTAFDRTVWFIIISLVLLIAGVSWWGTLTTLATDAERPLEIVYTAIDAGGVEQLYAIAAQPDDAAAVHALTSNAQGVWDYSIAPDGRIVYTASDMDGTSDFWLVPRDGGEPEYLLDCPNAACSAPSFSPDGRFLAFTRRSAATLQTRGGLSPPRIWLLNMQSGESAQLISDNQTLGFDPHWSADSAWLSFLSPDPAAVTVYNVNDGRRVTYETQTGESGIWHPTDTLFLTSELTQLGPQFVVHMLLIDPVAKTEMNLSGTDALVEDNAPAWSPNGAWIAFRRKVLAGPRASNGKQLWLMRADGSDARPLTEDADFDHGTPAWSPDGRQLLYHRFPLKGPNIVLSVWVMDVESGTARAVANPGQRPQWWP